MKDLMKIEHFLCERVIWVSHELLLLPGRLNLVINLWHDSTTKNNRRRTTILLKTLHYTNKFFRFRFMHGDAIGNLGEDPGFPSARCRVIIVQQDRDNVLSVQQTHQQLINK